MAVRWYVARTRPRGECAARDYLQSMGFEVFLPCVQASGLRRGHRPKPLFPGYLFLRHDLEAYGYGPLRCAPQVRGLVSFGGTSPPVPDTVMAELAERVEAMKAGPGPWGRLEPGDWVHVTVGRTRTLAQVVAETRSAQARVRVLLDFLGRQVPAEVPLDSMEYLGAIPPAQPVYGRAPRRTRGRQRWLSGYGPRALDGPGSPALGLHNGRSLS